MRNNSIQRAATVALLALNIGTGQFALASGPGRTGSSGTRLTSSTITPDGITGTDPEPISPSVVSIILALLNLA